MCGIAGWADFTKDLTGGADRLRAMIKKLTEPREAAEGYWISENAMLGHRIPSSPRHPLAGPAPAGRERRGGAAERESPKPLPAKLGARLSGAGDDDGTPAVVRRGRGTYAAVLCGDPVDTGGARDALTSGDRLPGAAPDADLLLRAYLEWGDDFLGKFGGPFALAIADVPRRRLILARDRLGIKSLFYARRGAALIFASEFGSLLSHGEIEPRLGREGLCEIFAAGPGRTPGAGIFEGVYEVKPGEILTFEPGGFRTRKYWSLASETHGDSFDTTVKTVRKLVFNAVLGSIGVPDPAYLLSGGLDSSVICAIGALSGPIRTLSVDYVDNDKNFTPNAFQPNADAPFIGRVSRHIGTDHATCYIDTPELVAALGPAALGRGLPGMADVDASLLLFCRFIKERADTALTGEAADEMFCGYPWFYRETREGSFPWMQRQSDRIGLLSPELVAAIKPHEYTTSRYEEARDEVPKLHGEPDAERHHRLLHYLTVFRWMPVLLERQERMSAAAGLRLIAPYSDHRILEYMWNVPSELKSVCGREKGLFRLAMEGLLPDDVLWRKKSPFPKTHNPDYLGAVRALILKILNDTESPLLPLINAGVVRSFTETMTRSTDIPWFGQLMNAPQMLAYLLQVDHWMRTYRVIVS